MARFDFLTRFRANRSAVAAAGTFVFGLLFHFGITNPSAQARADAPRGKQRLAHALGRASSRSEIFFADRAMDNLFGKTPTNFADSLAGRGEPKSPEADASSPTSRPNLETIADPALLKTLQAALREKRDAEYVLRLRRFHRSLAPLQCPPLPTYSLKNVTMLSDTERYIAACHERKQLQAKCVIPSSIFEPMRCPQDYQWDTSERWEEEERKWLAERTSK